MRLVLQKRSLRVALAANIFSMLARKPIRKCRSSLLAVILYVFR